MPDFTVLLVLPGQRKSPVLLGSVALVLVRALHQTVQRVSQAVIVQKAVQLAWPVRKVPIAQPAPLCLHSVPKVLMEAAQVCLQAPIALSVIRVIFVMV